LQRTLLAAPSGSTLSVGDLPFHYVVDADGDQVALPTTEAPSSTMAAAESLRRVGIDALMAHKGQPELRIAGLDASTATRCRCLGWRSLRTGMSFRTELQGECRRRKSPPKARRPARARATAPNGRMSGPALSMRKRMRTRRRRQTPRR
jgi:type VI secretion system protein ImpC